MFKSVELKNADSCLTYALKRIGCFTERTNIDGYELFEKINKTEITDFKNCEKGDLIVVKRKKQYVKRKYYSITENGVVFYKNVDLSFHFMVFEGDFITDFGYEGIGTCQTNYFNLNNPNCNYFKISYKDIVDFCNLK